jgi:hypothetical protein
MMPKRKLRIVRNVPPPAIGVCECSDALFKSDGDFIGDPIREIREPFGNHICEAMDGRQNALRIVREATEGKSYACPRISPTRAFQLHHDRLELPTKIAD